MSDKTYSIILAGNCGKNLWPLNKSVHPFNKSKSGDDYTLFQSMFLKLIDFSDDKDIVCVTDSANKLPISKQLDELQEKFCRNTAYTIVEEPQGRGTFGAIGIGVRYILEILNNKKEVDPFIVIFPSDLLIKSEKRFDYFLEKGKALANDGYFVCFGNTPEHLEPHTKYFTVKNDKNISKISKYAFKITDFKNDLSETEFNKFSKSSKLYTNCGIYMFKASVFLTHLKTSDSNLYKQLNKLKITSKSPSVNYIEYCKIPELSIEQVLFEKCKKLALLNFKIERTDYGHWENIMENSPKDKKGNSFSGITADINSKNTYVYATSRLVATSGLNDVCVVETPETVLVCKKDEIKNVSELKIKNQTDKTVYKPWGYYTVLTSDDKTFLTKIICINPHQRLSLQKHNYRSEHWVVLQGSATIIKGDAELTLNQNCGIDIAPKEQHCIINNTDSVLKVFEIQTGEKLSEKDIIRIEDIYGRTDTQEK